MMATDDLMSTKQGKLICNNHAGKTHKQLKDNNKLM